MFLISEIGLKHIPEIKEFYEADWRLLNASHAYADAVLLSGQTIRDEEEIDCSVQYRDLVQFRKTLGHRTPQPIQCILTDSGDFPLDRPLFHKNDLKVWIFTSSSGKRAIETARTHSHAGTWSEIEIFALEGDKINGLLQHLRSCGIRYLDVSSGGQVIQKMIAMNALDELRMTSAGHIAGPLNSMGLRRPNLFPKSIESYGPQSSPLIAWKGIRTIGEHLIFFRGKITYRNMVKL